MAEFVLPPETHIGYAHLKVSDLEGSLAFYRDLIGFNLRSQAGQTAVLAAGTDSVEHLFLTAIPQARPKPRRTTGLYHVAIRVPSRLALGRVLQRLLESRWPLLGASDHKVSEALYLSDPDDNGLEIYTDRPRTEWPWGGGQVVMATDPLDLQSLLEAAEQNPEPWRGIDPETDIGHIHLHVSDLAKAEAFYSGLLGLEVTQRSYPGALFLSAGGYHHHVGLNIWAGRGAPPPPDDAVGLFSFLLETLDTDWRQKLLNRLREAGVSLEPGATPGYEDRVLVKDPDGNRIEI